jgi:hypothetical protein
MCKESEVHPAKEELVSTFIIKVRGANAITTQKLKSTFIIEIWYLLELWNLVLVFTFCIHVVFFCEKEVIMRSTIVNPHVIVRKT